MGRVHWVSKRAPVVLRLNRYCFGFFVGDAEGVGNNRAKAERLRGCKRHFKSPSFPVVFLGFLLHLHVNPRRNYGFRRVDVACLNNEVVGTWARRIFFFLAFQRQGRYLGCDFVILRVLALFLAVWGFLSCFVAAFHFLDCATEAVVLNYSAGHSLDTIHHEKRRIFKLYVVRNYFYGLSCALGMKDELLTLFADYGGRRVRA